MIKIDKGIKLPHNGEKCPYCELIMLEDMDILEHMKINHKKEIETALFGGEI